jgi:hypothetical protein
VKRGERVLKSVVTKDFCVSDKNFYNYSVDMIRISCKMSSDFFTKKIDSRLIGLSNISRWSTTKLNLFKNNISVNSGDGQAFWIGFISNSELYCGSGGVGNPKHKYNFTLEFNPNKIHDNILLDRLIKYIFSLSYDSFVSCPLEWSIISCDFAFDINENILNIGGFDKGHKKCIKTFDNGGEDKTYYIGKDNNRLKIYNKKLESGLDFDCTRIELSHSLDKKHVKTILRDRGLFDLKLDKCFPKLHLKEYQFTFEDKAVDSTLRAVLFAVNCGYPVNELSRRYKDKVAEFMNKKSPIEIEASKFNQSLILVLSYYFDYLVV